MLVAGGGRDGHSHRFDGDRSPGHDREGDRAALAINAGDGRVHQAPLTDAVDYVALGDSYSSGVGTGVYDAASGACARSPLSYPPLWAAEHHPASVGFVACSGAKTADVLANQIPALQPSTDLVTITIGGNDAGFRPVLQTCTVAESDRRCFAAVNAAEAFERSVLRDRLARTYPQIRRAARPGDRAGLPAAVRPRAKLC